MRIFLKRFWICFALLIILTAIFFSLFRALTPWAEQYKPSIERHLSHVIGVPVVIESMETGWYWFEPVIKLKQIALLDGNKAKTLINAKELFIGINVWSSLWHWQIQPGVLFIDNLHLNFHYEDSRWKIEGLSQNKMDINPNTYRTVLSWILAQHTIHIKNLSAQIKFEKNQPIKMQAVNLKVENHAGQYQAQGKASMAGEKPTVFTFLAALNLKPSQWEESSGHIYFSTQRFNFKDWQPFLSLSQLQFLEGEGNVQLWLDLKQGRLQTAQAQIGLNDVHMSNNVTNKQQNMPLFMANLAWKSTDLGWELTADRMHAQFIKQPWPIKSLLVRYNQQEKTYFIYLKKLLLKPFSELPWHWPDSFAPFIALQPRGELKNVQLEIEKDDLKFFLATFKNLSWKTQSTIPGVNHLSGVLDWRLQEGHLNIDSKDVTFKMNHLPSQNITQLNASLSWKPKGETTHLVMEHFTLKHPYLLISADGSMDKKMDKTIGQTKLHAQFSGKKIQQWLPFLPSFPTKPKLEYWLKHDIKSIDNARGELIFNGEPKDFPFDNNEPGEFLIRSNLNGVNLVFAKEWPMAKNMNAYLTVDKRHLIADISQTNLRNILLKDTNLSIEDLGLDHEVLEIKSNIATRTEEALSFIHASPLAKRLASLNRLDLHGKANLILKLGIPLAAYQNAPSVLGTLTFIDNQLVLYPPLEKISLQALNGELQFDQDNILSSQFTASFFNNPVQFSLRSYANAETQVNMQGKFNIERLKEQVQSPVFTFLEGETMIQGLLSLPKNEGDTEHLQFTSSLQGLAINLPAPFKKSKTSQMPFTLHAKLDFNEETQIEWNYQPGLKGNMIFLNKKNHGIQLHRGWLQIGKNLHPSKSKNKPGLHIIGKLNTIDANAWYDVYQRFHSTNETDTLNLSAVDLKFDSLRFADKAYKKLTFLAEKTNPAVWHIKLNQEKFMADLNYTSSTNTVKGICSRFALDELPSLQTGKTAAFKPTSLPNLDVIIQSLHYQNIDVGKVELKTRTVNEKWQIETCEISSPYYQLQLNGDWKISSNQGLGHINGELDIGDLAKSLEHWKINPVVEANRGTLQFWGGWDGAFYPSSMTKLNGQINIRFKNGRITHLSPETEEKLGLGKLLSILSLQTIPRRLKLDFSDLSEKGYSFDQFNGNFTLENGILKTQDSAINGPVAYASMKGQLDILKQRYDLDLEIYPHIAASLPVVATIAGGPIAGVVTWVASKIINQGMQKINGYTYKVSGPWKQPTVQQVKIINHEQSKAASV